MHDDGPATRCGGPLKRAGVLGLRGRLRRVPVLLLREKGLPKSIIVLEPGKGRAGVHKSRQLHTVVLQLLAHRPASEMASGTVAALAPLAVAQATAFACHTFSLSSPAHSGHGLRQQRALRWGLASGVRTADVAFCWLRQRCTPGAGQLSWSLTTLCGLGLRRAKAAGRAVPMCGVPTGVARRTLASRTPASLHRHAQPTVHLYLLFTTQLLNVRTPALHDTRA
jgi:hypothetical protein